MRCRPSKSPCRANRLEAELSKMRQHLADVQNQGSQSDGHGQSDDEDDDDDDDDEASTSGSSIRVRELEDAMHEKTKQVDHLSEIVRAVTLAKQRLQSTMEEKRGHEQIKLQRQQRSQAANQSLQSLRRELDETRRRLERARAGASRKAPTSRRKEFQRARPGWMQSSRSSKSLKRSRASC